ncbi:ABC transporter substrate-binding protein [Alteribacillus bidgolensis]|uniref:Carbohydrate ABC transporter substrate-binding protein, CUT1 family n=1 Tax=Alteribacillus bidgolensis TaxID=930129 RepID=A0A1G8HKI1_9BACI|nr:extracellular solute-binding protein [Alteribacillus bidgolensis]SDI07179.1 carbohydrate ABC transporter substrate-binding protein, CUT1 family [Alteribacillus bidgolensis]
MWKKGGFLFSFMAAMLLAACGESSGDDGQVELELFSNKVENIGTYQSLIEKFEEKHPNIKVDLYAPPEAETILRTRLVKDDMPDMLAIAGSALYGELADAGILKDYSDSGLIEDIQPAYLEMLDDLTEKEPGGTYGVPYATNANTVIYNKEKFEQLGVEPPKTWDEFIEILDKAKEEGEIPIYFTLQEAWTGMIAWNAVAGNLEPEQFAQKKNNDEASFQQDYQEVADKMLTLLEYGHDRTFGIGYDDGNNAFANGEGVIYLQGNWAVPELLEVNPDLDLGVFPMPVTNEPDENDLVSGVDVLFATLEESEHPEEAQLFIDFMLEEENMKQYTDEQAAFPALEGVYEDDPVLGGIRENFEEGRITSFPDHYYPPGIGAENLIQEFYIQKDKERFLQKMDNEWEKVERRY